MSYAPRTLLDLHNYLEKHSVPGVGIVGDSDHTYGYHLGKDRLKVGDYSIQHARDKAGLTNAASAFDIGNHSKLKDITNYIALNPGSDIREIIGPGFDGRAYRWARENDFNREGPRAKGDSHEWHCHISYYRDSEYRDKLNLFKAYFGEDIMPTLDSEDLDNIAKAVWKMSKRNDLLLRPGGDPNNSEDYWTPATYLAKILGGVEALQQSGDPVVYETVRKAIRDQFDDNAST